MAYYYNKASEETIQNIIELETECYQNTINLVNSLEISKADRDLLIYRINRIYDWRERYELVNDDEQ